MISSQFVGVLQDFGYICEYNQIDLKYRMYKPSSDVPGSSAGIEFWEASEYILLSMDIDTFTRQLIFRAEGELTVIYT